MAYVSRYSANVARQPGEGTVQPQLGRTVLPGTELAFALAASCARRKMRTELWTRVRECAHLARLVNESVQFPHDLKGRPGAKLVRSLSVLYA